MVISLGKSAAAETPQETLDKIMGIDGSGSGLDADFLDGQDGTYYRDWNNLTNVPAGFSDGVDADSGGDITAVNPTTSQRCSLRLG